MRNLAVSLCLLSAPLFVSQTGFAHCLEDRWIFLEQRTLQTGNCEAGNPLELAGNWKSYPLMHNNPYFVRYWRGSFLRKTTIRTSWLHLVINGCGTGNQVILSERVNRDQAGQVGFEVENPNLSDTVEASYQLVPLSDREAREALEAAHQRCEKYVASP